jgi:iron complex outermembrane receptor protein
MAGVGRCSIDTESYGTTGAVSSRYDKSKITSTESLIYKPLKWLSAYATYIESLEDGVVVPETASPAYTNAGDVLAPLASREYETGVKANVGDVQLGTALFRLEKANQLDVTNANKTHTYIQDGQQVHQGVEFTAMGKAFKDLTIYGGCTFMDANIEDQQNNKALEGKCPAGIAEQIAKLHAEYEIPGIKGLAVNGGVNYTGPFYSDAANTDKLPSVVTFDAGTRYGFKAWGHDLTVRLDVTNLTNKSYWSSQYYVGDPLEATLMVEIRL